MTETEGDAALRSTTDNAEAYRTKTHDETGAIAEATTGDFHAARLSAKQNALRSDDPAADAVAGAEALHERQKAAAASARREALGGDSDDPATARAARGAEPVGRSATPPAKQTTAPAKAAAPKAAK